MTLSLPNLGWKALDESGQFTLPWKDTFQRMFQRIMGGKDAALCGKINTTSAAVGNVGTGEDNLMTYTLPKNTLAVNGSHIEIIAFGNQAANANNKTIKLKFGATTIFSTGAVASNGIDWEIRATIIRTAAATQVASGIFSGDTVLVTSTASYTAPTETLSGDIVIKCTGEATATDDISQKGLIVKYFDA